MILIDPPMWPAHRTRFAHLVSDRSLAELHSFAAAAGLAERAFDGDHYDVPEERHSQLVRLGAAPVSAGELIRRLRSSGLRLPARARPERVQAVLTGRWQNLMPGRATLGDDLLARWSQPHRRYHTSAHLLDVLTALDQLCTPSPPPVLAQLAAWYHDAVYTGAAGEDEQASAELASRTLPAAGLTAEDAAEVVRLVLLTRTHSPAAGDTVGAVFCDADLAVLGRDSAGYARYLQQVRAEYAHVSEPEWRIGRSAVVRHLLSLQPLFHSSVGAARWESTARRNLEQELHALASGETPVSSP